MKKKIAVALSLVILFTLPLLSSTALAQTQTYIVQPGDSLWKIAVKHQIGISEIIAANRQIPNPDLIYPGQKVYIPNIDNVKSEENEVIRLVNEERAKAGLQPLKANWELSRVARYKSQDMADRGYFSHQSPTYGSPFEMMKNFGIRYRAAGENIAMGYRTPQEVMKGWMNSPGHRKNILNPNFTEIGVGLAKNSRGVKYWTQMFIRP